MQNNCEADCDNEPAPSFCARLTQLCNANAANEFLTSQHRSCANPSRLANRQLSVGPPRLTDSAIERRRVSGAPLWTDGAAFIERRRFGFEPGGSAAGRTNARICKHTNKTTADHRMSGRAEGSRTEGPSGKRAHSNRPTDAAELRTSTCVLQRVRSRDRTCARACVFTCAHQLQGHAGGRGELLARADVDRLEDVEARLGDHRAGGLSRCAASAVAGRRDKLLQRHACAVAAFSS